MSGSLSARSRIAFFSKISVAALSLRLIFSLSLSVQLEFFTLSLSLHRLSFFLFSLQKRRVFPTPSFTHSSCPSQIVLGAEMNKVVCVCVLRPRFTSTQCACMKKNSAEKIFSHTILIHVRIWTLFSSQSIFQFKISSRSCAEPKERSSPSICGIFVFTAGKKNTRLELQIKTHRRKKREREREEDEV